MATKFTKDPGARLDFDVDWSAWLAGDTIVASTWAVSPAGALVVDADAFNVSGPGKTTVWLDDGANGSTYRVSNTITTAAGREDVRSFNVKLAPT